MKTPIPLRLVGSGAAPDVATRESREDVLAALISWLGAVGGALPADADVLARLWPVAPTPETTAIARAVVQGCRRGHLRKVVIGKEPHLLLANAAQEAALAEGEPRDVDAETRDLEQEKFALRLEVDVEHERVLLYRILLVLGLIGGSLIARQAVFWWFGL